jgi:hypothetical protein
MNAQGYLSIEPRIAWVSSLIALAAGCASPSETQLAVQVTTDSAAYALTAVGRTVLVRTTNVSGDMVWLASCNGTIRIGLEHQTSDGWISDVFICANRSDGHDIVSGVSLPPGAVHIDSLRLYVLGTYRVRAPLLVGREPRYSEQRSAPFEMR